MAQVAGLREHIIHLLEASDDENVLVRCVKILEMGTDGGERPSVLSVQLPTESDGLSVADDDGLGDNDEIADDEEPMQAKQDSKDRRRIAVSAAPIAINTIKDFTPRVVPKPPSEEEVVRKGVQACHLFATMEAEEREVIVQALEKEEFPAGTEVLRQGGAPKDKFYMITEGTTEVIKNGKHVASLNQGMTFGELEMMYKQTECAATIRCVTPCVMYALDQQSYQHIVLNVSIQKREKYQRLLTRVSFLEALSDYDRMTIAEALVTTEYQQDEKIISFGEKGQWMHIIVEGAVQVVGRDRGKKVDVVRLDEGNVVGELEFLFDHLTVADVVAATSRVVTAKINRKHFEMVLGPITDQLKKFVAKNETYVHYLAEADDKVKQEINKLEKRVRRVAKAQGEVLENLDHDGEIIISDPALPSDNARAATKNAIHRFPLKPVQDANFIMIGLREDGTIVMWNEAMARVTNYQAAEVQGQSFYSFLHSVKDQETMHTAINTARGYTGNIEGFYQEQAGTEKKMFVFARSDGLTKATLQLTVIPPVVAQGQNVADVLLAIGQEVKRAPTVKQNDHSHWVAEQVRAAINDTTVDSDEKLSRIGGLIGKFESLVKGSNASTEELRVVNVRQLIGQLVMDYGGICVEKHLGVTQTFSNDLYGDEVYCDAHLLPECLRYAMSNCCKHIGENATIRIHVTVEESFGSEQLVISFSDTGPGFSQKVLDEFNGVSKTDNSPQLLRVKAAVEKQGGQMTIDSCAGDTQVIFRIPFIPQEDSEDENAMMNPDLAGSMAPSQTGVYTRKQNYTTLVVEDTPAHRNMLCAFLWERKHAVLPAYSMTDINRLNDVTDILIVDPQQSVLSDPTAVADPFAMLRERARHVAVIVTGPSFDEGTKKAYQAAGILTLQKPCTALQAVQVLRKAEEKISKIKSEAEKIAQTRVMLAKNSRGAWKKGQLLGKGAFGEVYEAIDVLTGGKMAVKMLRITDKMNKDELLNEIEVMCTLQHPNIIHYFYCEENTEANTINVFMEYAGGGTLQGLLKEKGKLEFKEFQSLLRDVVEGLAYCHANRYVHCDIKTANVLLNHEGKGKIGDFGTAKQLDEGKELYIMQGSPLYMSPECTSAGDDKEDGEGGQVGYSFPSDIWSLGCVVMEMATLKPPFSHIEITNPMGLISYLTKLTDVPDLSPLFEHPPSVIEFVAACLHPDPAKRPTAQALLGFSIFNETTDDDMKSALKALKRAQLLHVLNKFVAFQDEDEVLQFKKDQAKFKTARRESAFFDSSDDEDEDDGKKDGGESDFFASSDDEEEDDDDDKKKKDESPAPPPLSKQSAAPAAPAANSGESSANNAFGEGNASQTNKSSVLSSGGTPTTRTDGTGVFALFPMPDPPSGEASSSKTPRENTPRAETSSHSVVEQGSGAVAPAPPRPGRHNLFSIGDEMSMPPPAPRPPTAPNSARGETSTPVTQKAPVFVSLTEDPRDKQKGPSPTAAASDDTGNSSSEASSGAKHVMFTTPRPPTQEHPALFSPHHHRPADPNSALISHQRHQVIVLHDALLMLVDEIKKLNKNVETTDALLAQYKSSTGGEGGSSTAAAGEGALVSATVTSSAENSTTANGTPPAASLTDPTSGKFIPNVEQLLRDDTAVIRSLIATLSSQ